MRKIKIGYFADGPWSHEAFKLLIADESIEIKFIVPRSDTGDNTLKNFALQYGIDYLTDVKVNSKAFYARSKQYECDLFVSMSYNQIFRNRIINLPKYKTINCHAGKLPFYRGRNILNWVLINDEKEFGITIHYMDEGIDTGDIILQKVYPIRESDTYETLLKIAYSECAKILYNSIKLIQSGKVDPVKQNDIHPVGMYCGVRKEGDEILNWDQNSRDIFCFVRALCLPGPVARTFLNGEEVKIHEASEVLNAKDYKGIPGQVVGVSENTFFVKTLDNIIEIKKWESKSRIKVGDRFK